MTDCPESTSSQEDFPVSPLVPPAGDEHKPTSDGSGPRWPESSANSDPAGYSSRTCLVCEPAGLTLFDVTLIPWGIAAALPSSPLARLVPHTHDSGCSLWPTVVASDGTVRLTLRLESLYRRYTERRSQFGGIRRGETFVTQVVTDTRRYPNPSFAEWMMGFPPSWTDVDLPPSATPLSHR